MKELTDDTSPRLRGTGITVLDIYRAYARDGYEPPEIAHAYGLGLDDVHYALAHYYSHAPDLRDLDYEEYTVDEALSESGRER
ncbi:DUF433 domain-containing protein [Haloarcula laminariae]|uniref:DUF433 domain-containing protein n=1 Tax=Haloarcula laminariae TaxID=2961577 RepID=UPI0021C97F91|nr:DUF433 domain-containing protein [Halomicroarcula laminariae]